MLAFIDGIRYEYFPSVNQVSYSDCKQSLNGWLTKGDSYLVTQDQVNDEFIIDVFDSMEFISPYGYDINRLSCAAIESINNIYKQDTSPKFLGWNLTKYYYSAFFSAHCILRIFRRGLLKIDANSIVKVNKVTQKYGYSIGSYSSGLYSLELLSMNKYKFYKNLTYNNSHEGLWKRFLDFLTEIIPSVYSNLILTEAQQIVDKIEELKQALCYTSDSINGNWLSKVRNSINYSQSYGTWFPYVENNNEHERIYTYQSLSKDDPLNIDLHSYRGRDLIYFVKTCQLINAICFKALSDIKSRHPLNKSFVENGIYKYHNRHLKKTEVNSGLLQ